METVLLVIHLIVVVCLIGIVLLQRSEGGGLGMGGGGGVMTGRQAATAMTKVTWAFGIAFLVLSIALTILAASDGTNRSVLDRLEAEGDGTLLPPGDPAGPAAPAGEGLLPPAASDAPLTPPRSE